MFVKPLQTSMTWNRTEIMAAFSIFLIVSGIMSPFSGRMIERYGSKKVISIGSLVTGAGLVILSYMSNLWHFYLAYVLLSAGWASTGQVTLSFIVSHWFKKRRGLAMGILGMGMSGSGLVFAPFVAVLLIPNLGWRAAYLTLAIINCIIILPLSLFVIRTKPSDMGLYPDGIKIPMPDPGNSNKKSQRQSTLSIEVSWQSALGTLAFWFIGMSLFFNHTHVGVIQGIFPHLTDIGFSEGIAASAFSILCLAGFCGMFFFGWLCDKIPVKLAAATGLGVIALGILILIIIGPHSSVWLIWFFAVIFGFGTGSFLPTMSLLTSATFGLASYATLFGMMTFFQYRGAGAGPLLTGIVYDATNSYFWAFTVILAMVVLAIPLVLSVKRPGKFGKGPNSNKDF